MFFAEIVLFFFIYSFAGWVVELLWHSIVHKKIIETRGVLFGPYCPIYGFGALLVLGTTYTIKDNLLLVFLAAVGLCSVLEYFTSFILEKIFNIRWWDYSETRKLNINGRICLTASIGFGVFGIIATQWVQPFIENCISLIPDTIQIIIALVLFVVMLTDSIASMLAAWGAKKVIDFSKTTGDRTAEVKRTCKAIAKTTIKRTAKKIGAKARIKRKSQTHHQQ